MINKNNSININFFINLIPFVLLILIGLIPGNITYHQKVFKTLLILITDIALLFVLIFYYIINNNYKDFQKKIKYIVFFVIYFLYILIQFIVSYFSGEISYDREYYLANYTLLIILSLFFYLFLNNLDDIEYAILLFNLMFLIIMIWIIISFALRGFKFQNFRPDISFGNTDYFAGYIIGIIPLSITSMVLWIYKIKENQNDETKNFLILLINLLNFILVPMGIISLIFSQTKAAFIGFFLGTVLLLFIGITSIVVKRKLFRFIIIISVILIIALLTISLFVFQPPFFKVIFDRFIYAYKNFNFVMKDRTENAWAGGLGLFKSHPFYGAGLGTVYPASFKFVGKYFFLYSTSNSFKHAHCEYVEILGEAGIVGILIFSLLILYVLISLLKKVFSSKYKKNYRLFCLGSSSGLISMLIHQAFSLSLRMSVTMSMFFFLIGFSIFLISIAKKSKLDHDENNIEQSEKNSFLNKIINSKKLILISITISILIVISFILYLPLLFSEYNLVKATRKYNYDQYQYIEEIIEAKRMNNKIKYDKALQEYRDCIDEINKLYNNAIKFKKDNVYAWTDKYVYDINSNLMNAPDAEKEKIFKDIKKDLDSLNSIIPLYQDIWQKYVNYYLKLNEYYVEKHDYTKAYDSLKEALNFINKSLNINFLNESFHLKKLELLMLFKDKEEHLNAINDYIIAKIYLKYSRDKKIIKEKIIINNNSDKTYFKKENNLYCFFINQQDINELNSKFFSDTNSQMDNNIFLMFSINEVREFLNKNFGEIN